jgi:hypothetical protein
VTRIPIGRGLIVLAVGVLGAATAASAQVTITGTGNPAVDVPAVQAAVDGGGTVRLRGTFSFDVPPVDDRTILVVTDVVIEGVADEQGNPPVIMGGVKPFQVNAPGRSVAIRGLRFVGAILTVIEVRAADGVAIEHCRIEGVEPLFASAIGSPLAIGVVLGFFSIGTVVGDISIVQNEIEVGGTAADRTEAIAAIGVGRADQPVDLHIAENIVRNTTAHGIDVRNIVGSAVIERNDVRIGAVGGQMVTTGDRFVDGIRCLGAGSYLVAHNRVDVGYENSAGIRLQGGPTAPVADALVFGNDVRMSGPVAATFGSESAGIELRRAAAGNVVLSNRISGRASTALALVAELGGAPEYTTFIGNNLSGLAAALADVSIAAGVVDTIVIGGHGTVVDLGTGTVVKGGYVDP